MSSPDVSLQVTHSFRSVLTPSLSSLHSPQRIPTIESLIIINYNYIIILLLSCMGKKRKVCCDQDSNLGYCGHNAMS